LPPDDFQFLQSAEGLSLQTKIGVLAIDFVGDKINYARPLRRGKNELIAKAVGIGKGLTDVVDATAGLAQDAVVLARLGCRVRAVERIPWIAPLLEDAKRRAAGQAEWLERIDFFCQDSREFLQSLSVKPEVIYLDPMFPDPENKSKKSALPRKEMQIFRNLVGPDGDARELFDIALAKAQFRVVVKRPKHAPDLAAGVAHRFTGNSVRYDLYLTKGKI